MSAARALIRQTQINQINNGALIAGLVVELGGLLRIGKLSGEEFITTYLLLAQAGHNTSATTAARFVEEYRKLNDPAGGHAEAVLAGFDPGAAYGRAVNLLEDTAQLDRTQDDYDQAFRKIIERAAITAYRHILNAGRDTVELSAAANGARWRRVTDGNPCAFCAMLATRSDYWSAESAGSVTGIKLGGKDYRKMRRLDGGDSWERIQEIARGAHRDKKTGQLVARAARAGGKRPLGSQYHDHCGCTVVEAVGQWATTPEEERYREAYDKATEQCQEDGVPANASNILARMREQGSFNDSPKPRTKPGSGAGGGGKPPKPRPAASGDEPQPSRRQVRPPRERTPADNALWQKRQDALPFTTTGATMKPHEIEFAEAFTASGFTIVRWLPTGKHHQDGTLAKPTADYVGGNGKEFELKRSNNLQTIKRHIKKALAQGKTRFMIDCGDRPPRRGIRSGLAAFSPETGRLKELWVFWNGHLERLQ